MTIDELKAMLAEGKITQEQFDVMAKAIDPDYTPEGSDPHDDAGKANPTGPDVDKLIQSAVDRAVNKWANENKALKTQLETIKKEKLTAEERAELERKQEREQFEQERAAFQIEKNKLYAVKAIKAAGLDDGSDQSLALVDFVLGESEADIDERVKAFAALVKKFVAADVDKTFRAAGRSPGKGASGDNEINPYSKDHFNLTKQWELEASDPEKAKRMQAAALAMK